MVGVTIPWADGPMGTGMCKKIKHNLEQKRKQHSSMVYVLITETEIT